MFTSILSATSFHFIYTLYTSLPHIGVLVVEDFADKETCENLYKRAGQLIEGFEPKEHSIFKTSDQVCSICWIWTRIWVIHIYL